MKPFKFYLRIFLFVLFVFALLAGYIFLLRPMIGATKTYNNTVRSFNSIADEYNNLASTTCVSNIEGFDDIINPISIESEKWTDVLGTVFRGNNAEKIYKDVATLNDMSSYVSSGIAIMRQITNPDVTWVEDRLHTTQSIGVLQHVTEDNDPNGLLGKEGGYTGCVYFSIKGVDATWIKGNTILEKGTDGGGAVEIYKTLQDAEDRCEYFAGLDGTILYSGSYAIVGTMVIRTSFMLSDDDQFKITNEITEAFTQLSD